MTMINQKFVEIYGYVAIVVMAVMLALIWFEKIPRSLYLTCFIVAATLFLIRVTLRLIVARQKRIGDGQGGSKSDDPKPPSA